MAVVLKQGDDSKIQVDIVDNGSPVDLTSITKIKGVIKIGTFEEKYSLVSESGFGKISKESSPNNRVNVFVERDQSKNFPIGAMSLTLIVTTTDADFPEGERSKQYDFNIGRTTSGNGLDIEV